MVRQLSVFSGSAEDKVQYKYLKTLNWLKNLTHDCNIMAT